MDSIDNFVGEWEMLEWSRHANTIQNLVNKIEEQEEKEDLDVTEKIYTRNILSNYRVGQPFILLYQKETQTRPDFCMRMLPKDSRALFWDGTKIRKGTIVNSVTFMDDYNNIYKVIRENIGC